MKQKVIRTAAELVVAGVMRRAPEAPLGLVQAALREALRYHDDPGAVVSRRQAFAQLQAVREAIAAVVEELLAEREIPVELEPPTLVWVDDPLPGGGPKPRLSNFPGEG